MQGGQWFEKFSLRNSFVLLAFSNLIYSKLYSAPPPFRVWVRAKLKIIPVECKEGKGFQSLLPIQNTK